MLDIYWINFRKLWWGAHRGGILRWCYLWPDNRPCGSDRQSKLFRI